ncbi:hypothetical protein [Marixanthomonas spongiae]|uniref:Uncharacterized protein n=1 Tax=Marixanthomonas spongiae TaxID=2174845 RepID=A0A2U0I2D9_9FLAO|nr:hypothetical protein [Marixanthomonas spongiae]PVW15160.1 hypothetical protein DDV96_07055 [Marixanthomonas spongiae]
MDSKKIIECERTKIERWSRFQLPNHWKKIGIVLCLALFITGIVLKFTDFEVGWLKGVLRRGILVGLLIISISKDKNEDEMIVSLRSKAYTLAFIFGVAFTCVQPLLEYLIHSFIFEPSPNNTFSYFEVLSFMLMMHIVFFEILKRNR